MAISTAKLREEVLALTGMKVDIMLNDEEFKSTYQIMEEISRVWKDIADVDQAALLELLGGKRQANILSSMLTNFEVAQESLSKAMDSAGSAMAENEKYLDSIGGKLKQLEAAWESLSATVLRSELVKGVLDLAIGLTQAIDKIISALGSVEAFVGSAIVGISAKKGIGGIFAAITKGSGVAEAAMLGLKGGFVGLGIALAAIVGIKIGKWLWDIADSSYNAEKRIKSLSDEVSSMESKESDFTSLAQQFEDLSQATEKTQEYYDVQNQLHDLLPSLRGYYDEHGNYIITETAKVETLTAKWKDYLSVLKGQKTYEYLRDPMLGDSAYQSDVDNYNSAYSKANQIRQYMSLHQKSIQTPSDMTEDDYWALRSYKGQFGDITSAASQLRELEQILASITDTLQENALAAIQATEGWNTLSEEEKSAIEQWVGDLDVSTVQSIINAYARGSDDLIDQITEQALRSITQIKNETQDGSVSGNVPTLSKSQTNLITDIATLEAGIKTLGSAYKDFADDGHIAASTLSDLSTTFGECGDAWVDFVSVASNGDTTIGELSSSMDTLVNAFIQQKALTGDVTTETYQMLTEMLKAAGVTNAEQVATTALNNALIQNAEYTAAVADSKKLVSDDGMLLMTQAEAEALLAEGNMSDYAAQMVAYLALEKIACSDGGFAKAIEQDAAMVTFLGQRAGWSAEQLGLVAEMQSVIGDIASLDPTSSFYTSDRDALMARKAQLENEFKNIEPPKFSGESFLPDIDWRKITAGAGQTTDKISAEFQSMYDQLQAMREANLISEEEYLQRLFELNQQYNRNNVSAYRQYAMEIFNGMKSMMADRITAKYDSQISSLESERAEAERYYDGLIDAEQDKLDLLRQEWETEEHLLKIEKARAELARAQQQKNVRVYREGKGFVWEADQEKVQDATATVNNALKEYERYQKELAIEKRIEQLEELKEKVLESIDQQIEAARRAKEEALKNLEELQFGAEAFLQFLEMFGIEVDDKTLAMIKSFDLMAEQAGLSLDDLEGSLTDAGTSFNQFIKGEIPNGGSTGGSIGGQQTAGGGIGAQASQKASSGEDNGEYGQFAIFADFMKAMGLFQTELTDKLDELQLLWKGHLDLIQEYLKLFQLNGLYVLQYKVGEMVTVISEHLNTLKTTFSNFSTESAEALKPLVDQFNTLFMGQLENTFDPGSKEMLTWSEYFAKTMDAIIEKFKDWRDNYLNPYIVIVKEFHNWVMTSIKEEVEAVAGWRDALVDALTQVKEKLDALKTSSENAKTALENLKTSVDNLASSAGSAIVAVQSLASAINALQSKTVTIDVVTRHSTVGEPSIETTKSAGGTIKETTKFAGGTIKETINPDGSISTKRYASGVIGLSSNQWALTDEEGPELVIPGKGTFRRLKMGSSVLPADVSRNLWVIGQNPMGFAAGIANMISNRKEDNKTYQVNVGDIILHEVQNARQVANELKGLVLKAEQLAYSK